MSTVKLIDLRTEGGSRLFATLPESVPWYELRDHIAALEGTTVTDVLTDDVTEAWIDFEFKGYRFSVNTQFGEFWFFVEDPAAAERVLQQVVRHCTRLLG